MPETEPSIAPETSEKKPETPRLRRRRRAKFILRTGCVYAVAFASFLLIGLYLALPDLVSIGFSIALRRSVSIEKIQLGWRTIWIQGLEIQNGVGFSYPYFGRADQIAIEPNYGALLGGRLAFRSVYLDGPELYFEMDAKKRKNIPRSGKKKKKKRSRREILEIIFRKIELEKATLVRGRYGMRLERQNLELNASNLYLELRREASGAYYTANLDAPRIALRVGTRLETTGAIRLRDAQVDIDGIKAASLTLEFEKNTKLHSVGPALENFLDPLLHIPVTWELELEDLTRALHLPVVLEGHAVLDGTAEGLARNIQIDVKLVSPAFQAGRGGGRQLTGELRLRRSHVTARELRFQAFGGDVLLTGELELAKARRSLTAEAFLHDGRLLQLLQTFKMPLRLDARVGAYAQISSHGFSKEDYLGRIQVWLEGKGPRRATDYLSLASSEAPPPPWYANMESPGIDIGDSGSKVDLTEVFSLVSKLAAREARSRSNLGREETFPPKEIRSFKLDDLRDAVLPLTGRLDLSIAQGTVFIEAARLAVTDSELNGFGRIGFDKSYDLSFQVDSPEIGILAYAASPYLLSREIDGYPWTLGRGAGKVHGRIKGRPGRAIVDARFSIQNGLYQSFAFDKLQGSLQFEDDVTRFQALLADGDSGLEAKGWIKSGSKGGLEAVRSPFVSLDWLSLMPDLQIELESKGYSVSRLFHQLDWNLAGSWHLRGKADLLKKGGKLQGKVEIESLQAGWIGGQKVDHLTLKAQIDQGRLKIEDFDTSVNGSPISLVGLAEIPSRLELDFDAGPFDLEVLLRFFGLPLPVKGTVRLILSLEGVLSRPILRLTLETSDLTIAGIRAGDVTLDLDIQGAKLFVNASLFDNSIRVSGSLGLLPSLPLDLVLEFSETPFAPLLGLVSERLPLFIGGELDGRFELTGSAAHPEHLKMEGAFQRTALSLTELQVENAKPVRLQLAHRNFTLSPVILEGTAGSFTVQATYEVLGTFELLATGLANMAVIKAFDTTNAIESVTGKGEVGLRVLVERLREPRITGRATISDGYLKLVSLDQSIYNISGPIEIDYPNLWATEEVPVTAVFGEGPIQLWGTVVANSALLEDILLDLHCTGQKLRYHYLPEMDTIVSPAVDVRGTAAVPQVSGRLVMERARYRGRIELKPIIVKLAQQTTGELLLARPRLTLEEIEATSIDPVLDLEVLFPNKIQVDSKGVVLKISAPDFKVVGTYLRMGFLGSMSIDEGRLAYESQEFEVRTGTIDFLDPSRPEPSVNIEFQGEIEDYVVTIGITGNAYSPRVTFRSVPPLSELDILALILTGSASTYVNPETGFEEQRNRSYEQLVDVASIALQLEDSVFQRVGNILAADRFLVDPVISESGLHGARITWGKKLGKVNILASQILPATAPPLIIVQYKLSSNIFIEGRNNQGKLSKTDVDLKVRWNFK